MTDKVDAGLAKQIETALQEDSPVRLDFGRGERLHIDRPLPFLWVHIGRRKDSAARDVVTANSSYLLAGNLKRGAAIVDTVARIMGDRFGAFLVLDIGELARDDLAGDAAYLPPFDITLSASVDAATQAARAAAAAAIEKVHARVRIPRIRVLEPREDKLAKLARLRPGTALLTLRFAPIYKVPESEAVYPQLKEQLGANLVDACLQAAAAFAQSNQSLAISTHRALGRKSYIDAVNRADRAIDTVAQSFDFLLAVTPINAEAAWQEFSEGSFRRPPRFLYRPLDFEVDRQKKALFSVRLDHLEDPVLTNLYREKQQELDLQLSLLAARETPRFVEFGRALYGSVEPALLRTSKDILAKIKPSREVPGDADADFAFVERRARAMIKAYSSGEPKFAPAIELREDLPGGLMVSGARLLISRNTAMARSRVEALLSHEVGVHLLTYFNGSEQGLRLFRSGLAGYEGVQEGLAVLAEFLVGGMTVARLRLIAARVVGCAAMLDGAGFEECFEIVREHGLAPSAAFNLTLRVYRGGGLAKDAIYLRGLLEILAHLRAGGDLQPFWMGKIAASHFAVMQELSTRGLLKAPRIEPQFLSHPKATERLAAAAAGLSPEQMISI